MNDITPSAESLLPSLNSIFKSLSPNRLRKTTDLIDAGLLVDMCCEMDLKLFEPLQSSILNDKSFGILIADLKEVKDKLVKLLQLSGETFKQNYNTELAQIDLMLLAKYDKSEINKLVYLLILCLFFCEEKDTFFERIDSLSDKNQADLYNVARQYVLLEETDSTSLRQSTIYRKTTNDQSEILFAKIKELEDQLNIEMKNKDILIEVQKENDELKNAKINNEMLLKQKEYELKALTEEIKACKRKEELFKSSAVPIQDEIKEYKAKLLAKEQEVKNLNESFFKKENEYQDKISQLTAKIEINKEKEIQYSLLSSKNDKLLQEISLQKEKCIQYDELNKQYQDLKTAYENNSPVPLSQLSKSEIEKLKTIIGDRDKTISEANKRISQYELQLQKKEPRSPSRLAPKSPNRVEPKSPQRIEASLINDTITNQAHEEEVNSLTMKIKDLENELKLSNDSNIQNATIYKKEISGMQERNQKEMELISTAMYHLGVKFWKMKYEYEKELHHTQNWLYKERQKVLKGDY